MSFLVSLFNRETIKSMDAQAELHKRKVYEAMKNKNNTTSAVARASESKAEETAKITVVFNYVDKLYIPENEKNSQLYRNLVTNEKGEPKRWNLVEIKENN